MGHSPESSSQYSELAISKAPFVDQAAAAGDIPVMQEAFDRYVSIAGDSASSAMQRLAWGNALQRARTDAGLGLNESTVGSMAAAGFALGMSGSGPDGSHKLSRFDGPKPDYAVNPAHVPGQRGFSPAKTPLPVDAATVFSRSVPNDPKSPTAWFGRNENGQIYRFSLGNDGAAHFSGIDGVGSSVRNITKYALERLGGR